MEPYEFDVSVHRAMVLTRGVYGCMEFYVNELVSASAACGSPFRLVSR
jgi:hypothetical protein